MALIQIFDPAMCCSSGVCGTDVDQQLIAFAADVACLEQQGGQIVRFNLAHRGFPVHLTTSDPAAHLMLTTSSSALLQQRALNEQQFLAQVTEQHAKRWAVVPLQLDDPTGIARLQQLCRH